MRENIATAEPQGFGSRSVAIDLAKCSGSDCGIRDAQREKENATKRGTERGHERHKNMFIWGHMSIEKRVTKSITHTARIMRIQSQIQSLFFLVFTCWEEVTIVFPPPHLSPVSEK